MIDKERFVALIEAKAQTFYRVTRAILGNAPDCDDALQESVLKAWACRHQLREERYFATWMTRIVIRECHNLRRRQAKYVLRAEVEAREVSPSQHDDLHRAIDELPEKMRLPLVLHYIEGYALKEIAAMLRVPVSTVRSRLYAARKQLRLELDVEEGKEARRNEA